MTLFELIGKIIIDNSDAEKKLESTKIIAAGVGKGLTTVAKVGAAAVSAGVAGVTALTKMGIDGYKQYEQLAGGAQLLWGDAYDFIAQKASGAYKAVQMSQNDYLQQVNGFSTGLKTALGGNVQAAAELADRIITAEADIVAATGATQENVQNAFNGIMKSNFSMLDNLQLGITPTKEGFQQVIDKVNDWNKANGHATKYQISNLADCQAALLDYIEMQGLSGYAAMEASKTIEGSLAMMKGAWSNLVTGMADENANMELLINNFVESTAIAAQNLIPRIEQTLQGIGQLIEKMAPIIADALPVLVESLLPTIITAGISLITALANAIVQALPAIKTALIEGLVIILTEVFGVSEANARNFENGLNSAFQSIADGFKAMVESAQTDGTWLNEIWMGLKDTGKAFCDFCVALWDALSTAFTWCVEQINTEGTWLNAIWETIKTFISATISTIQGVIQLFTAILKGDWKSAWTAVQNIAQTVWNAIVSIISNNMVAAQDVISNILNAISGFFTTITEGIRSAVSEKFESMKSAISLAVSNAQTVATSTFNNIKTSISDAVSGALTNVQNTFESIRKAISDKLNEAWEIVQDIIEKVKKAFDFSIKLDIKLPHVSVHGGEAPYGIGGKGTLPSFSVEWYAKAMDNAMVLNDPTIFGYSNGKMLGAGEAGNEVVAGEAHLLNLIGQVVESKTATQNAKIIDLLTALLDAMVGGNEEMIAALMSDRTFSVGEREFARLVRSYA